MDNSAEVGPRVWYYIAVTVMGITYSSNDAWRKGLSLLFQNKKVKNRQCSGSNVIVSIHEDTTILSSLP